MSCFEYLYQKIWKKSKEKREEKKDKYFKQMKEGLNTSLNHIHEVLVPISNWEELMALNPDEDSDQEKEESEPVPNVKRSKTILKPIPKISACLLCCSKLCKKFNTSFCCLLTCFICGWLFCLIQLVGVQSGIIILNALFSEIVDEFKFLAHDSPKEYNFYEKIEIASYKSIPEIDVGMFWSFIGLIILKKYGFYWSILLQILSTIGFYLLFFLFDFHRDDKLLVYYSRIELTVLIVSYILLTFSVGSSSMIALKQFFNIYKMFYRMHFNMDKIFCQCCCCKTITEKIINNFDNRRNYDANNKEEEEKKKKERQKEKDKNLEQLFFYFFSTLSATFIIIINKKIFASFEDITSTSIKFLIPIIYGASFILSIPFYIFYSIPSINKKIKKKIEKKENDAVKKKKNKILIRNRNDSLEKYPNKKIKIESENVELKEEIINIKQKSDIKSETHLDSKSEEVNIKINFEELIKRTEIDNMESIKVCTCMGYMFFQKKIGNKNACIFYDYNSCCSWFCLKIYNPEIFTPFFIELFLQTSVVGFNSMLSEKLLKEYSFSKNRNFFINLFISLIYISLYIIFIRGIKFLSARNNRKNYNFCYIYCNDVLLLAYFIFLFSIGVFSYSIKYISKDFYTGEQLEYILSNMITLFKCLDFQMLSYYDFFDDSDCLNTAVVITFEKYFWMIIEIILDASEISTKSLFIVQLVSSFIFFILSLITIIILFIDMICQR